MRLDYVSYILAAVFFVLAAVSFVIVTEQTAQTLAVAITVVLGVFSLGLGCYERPRAEKAFSQSAPVPQALRVTTLEAPEEEKVEEPEVSVPESTSTPAIALTQVKGIGEKRAAQLKVIGINSVEELAQASVEDVAVKLKVYPKIVAKWVAAAKELVA